MAFQDLYEVTVSQTFQGQQISNVFHLYQELAIVSFYPTQAQALAEEFVINFLPLIYGFQPEDIITTGVRARNLFNVSDDYTVPLAIPGVAPLTTSILPTFTAVGFALAGDNAAVKNGAKRFAGITEVVVEDGVITNGTLLIQLDDLAQAMESYIQFGTLVRDNVWKFVIIKRIRSGVSPNYEYRLPETTAEGVFSKIIAVTFNALVTSQISRKIGVGA